MGFFWLGVIVGETGPLYFEEGAIPVFWTDSGKIEFYSQKLAAQGFDPMPTWHDDEISDPLRHVTKIIPIHRPQEVVALGVAEVGKGVVEVSLAA